MLARAKARARRHRRPAFSLLEVLLATAILLGSVVVLGELAGVGHRNAAAALERGEAQLICQSKLGELLAGLAPLTNAVDEPLLDSPPWVYSVDVEPATRAGLLVVRVTVSEPATNHGRVTSYSLTRWIRDPAAAEVEGEGAPSLVERAMDGNATFDRGGGTPTSSDR
jgi:hypothetical protein